MTARIALLVFATVFSTAVAVFLFRAARRERLRLALQRRLGTKDAQDSLLRDEGAAEKGSSLARLVAESGLGWTMGAFLARAAGAAVLGALLGVALGSGALAFLLCLGGFLVFPLAAHQARARRLALCDQQMPQALEIVSLALRAGHPLPTALAIAAAEAPQPIGDELRRCVEEQELGRPIPEVLAGLGKRLPQSEAVQTFVVAVMVLQQTGGNLIAVIDRIVENARARSQYRAKLRALTAEGRSSAKLLGLMPVAFGVLAAVVDPAYLSTLLGTFGGNVILTISAGLWIIGLLWTRRLVRTEG